MRVNIIIVFIVTALCSVQTLPAQHEVKIGTEIHSNQQVFISGEDIWLEGNITEGTHLSKSITARIIDRNGIPKAEKELLLSQNKFSGYLNIPQNLASDYYFLDCVIKGETTENSIQPIMVINPTIPPSSGCSSNIPSNQEQITYNARIDIKTNKDTYKERETVLLDIEGLQTLSDISVSVVRTDRLTNLIQEITTGFEKRIIHQAAGYKETEGHLVRVKVTFNNLPQPGIALVAGIKGKTANIATAISDQDGIANFVFPLSFESSQLVIKTDKIKDNRNKIDLLKIANKTEPIAFPCLKLNEQMREDLEARILNKSIQERFHAGTTKAYIFSDQDTTDFYGKPDQRYLLDEYVRFPVMEEIITEIIPEVRIRKENGKAVLQVLNEPFKTYFSQQALTLIDGIPVSNTTEILNADPLKIRSIDVISRRYTMGQLEFPGVIHFKSYKKDLAGIAPDENSLITNFEGLQESVNLQPPTFSESRIPDLRNILFHELNLAADESGKAQIQFNTADASGYYAVKIRALTPGKQVVYKEIKIKIS